MMYHTGFNHILIRASVIDRTMSYAISKSQFEISIFFLPEFFSTFNCLMFIVKILPLGIVSNLLLSNASNIVWR
jgi:hypothetical protein